MNKLANETSPYLLQHADNPVDWYPWGDEALSLAREQNRPILLSIGYSACHWCHVMAHESFEDPAIAKLMNELFVNIKVDREERPDLDQVYQIAHQFITRRPGGWPLTMFLHPADQRPFFGGTYFPKDERHGLPAFPDLLQRVAGYYRDNEAGIREHGTALVKAFARLEPGAPATRLDEQPLQRARDQLLEQLDREHGGFGTAPKFPHASSLERLLRHWRRSAHSPEPDTQALYAVALTLTRMAEGGIHDQIGGGFYRYSIDQQWEIPHFEKMLYDNGPLLALYAQMWQISADEQFRRVANDTADWAIREMRSPQGAFWSTLDADSPGGEGRFYLWTPESAKAVLEPDEYRVVATHYGLDSPPNFEQAWHLRVTRNLADTAAATSLNVSTVRRLLDSARVKLLDARDKREWPGRDEKILTAWNGLMIRGLAIATRALHREELAAAAAEAVDFIHDQLVVRDRLMACYKDGQARFPAYLDDHAWLLDALLELLQASWDNRHLEFAIWIAEQLLERFEDRERGGFYFTGNDQETLIYRMRPMSDDSLPSGNAIAALALNRLGHLLGETRYLDAAERTLRAAGKPLAEFPHGHPSLVTALEEQLYPPTIVVIRGEPGEARIWADTLASIYAPARLVFAIPAQTTGLPQGLAMRSATDKTVAYVCTDSVCDAPVSSLDELASTLSEVSEQDASA